MGDLGFWIEGCFSTRRLEIGGTGRIYLGFPWSVGRFEGLKSRRDLGVGSVELAGENIYDTAAQVLRTILRTQLARRLVD